MLIRGRRVTLPVLLFDGASALQLDPEKIESQELKTDKGLPSEGHQQ